MWLKVVQAFVLPAHICLCGSTNDKEPCALLIVINYILLSHYMVLFVIRINIVAIGGSHC